MSLRFPRLLLLTSTLAITAAVAAVAATPSAKRRRADIVRQSRPKAASVAAALKAEHGPAVRWNASKAASMRRFDDMNRRLSRSLCSGGADHRYSRLLQAYRGNGFYLPELPDGSPDLQTLRDQLDRVDAKIKWLDGLIEDLKGSREFPKDLEVSTSLLPLVDELLELKKAARLAKKPKEQREALEASRTRLKGLRKAFDEMAAKVPFLLSFEYPVDHMAAREAFEKAKASGGPPKERKTRSNAIFFTRKLHEDGAFNPDSKSEFDMYLRTTLDTVALRLKKDEDFLSEDLRYDLEWAVGAIESSLSRGRLVHVGRLKAWRNKVAGAADFYRELLDVPPDQMTARTRERLKHASNLKEFVLRKHAQAYRLLTKEPEMMQAMWVIEKILFNEVGDGDREHGYEKRDIAQIVINRRYHEKYSRIPPSDELFSYLTQTLTSKRSSYPWLNTFFREGEFSFTFFYIPSVVNVFCADRSKRGRQIQKENVEIAYDLLNRPNYDFQGLRYFSRRSMTGKIDMSSSWPEYVPIPERPGPQLEDARPQAAIRSGKYRYLYDFVDPKGNRYDVLDVEGETFAIAGFPDQPTAFGYRDPHSFKYFRKFQGRSAAEGQGE